MAYNTIINDFNNGRVTHFLFNNFNLKFSFKTDNDLIEFKLEEENRINKISEEKVYIYFKIRRGTLFNAFIKPGKRLFVSVKLPISDEIWGKILLINIYQTSEDLKSESEESEEEFICNKKIKLLN